MSRSLADPCSAALLRAVKATPCSSCVLLALLHPSPGLLELKLLWLLMLFQLPSVLHTIIRQGCCSCKAMGPDVPTIGGLLLLVGPASRNDSKKLYTGAMPSLGESLVDDMCMIDWE